MPALIKRGAAEFSDQRMFASGAKRPSPAMWPSSGKRKLLPLWRPV